VATREQSAAIVSFQRLAPSVPPTQNDRLAPCSLTSARHFSENHAIYATNAVTTASTATFKHKNGCQLKNGDVGAHGCTPHVYQLKEINRQKYAVSKWLNAG